MRPLAFAKEGTVVIIKRIKAQPQIKSLLKSMGFAERAKLTVITASGGNVIVKLRGTRIALSRDTAQKIIV